MQTRKVIAIFTANQGHGSLAQAAKALLEPDYEIVWFQVSVKMESTYTMIYRYVPGIFWLFYKITHLKFFLFWIRLWFDISDKKEVSAFLEKHQPVACLTTYFSFLPSIEVFAAKKQIPVYNIIANPRTTHPVEIANPPTINCVFDAQQAEAVHSFNSQARTEILGWLVRPEFHPIENKVKLKTELELSSSVPTVVIVGGSAGNSNISKLAKYLINRHPERVQLVVMCGNNLLLRRYLSVWRSQIPTSLQPYLQLVPYTTETHRYFQAADVVIGKAGPNTLFESVACETPFIATTHISGQEDGNLEIIEQHHLGKVLEHWDGLTKYLDEIIKNPLILQTFQPHLQTFAASLRASQVLLKEVFKKSI